MGGEKPSDTWLLINKIITMIRNQDGYSVEEMRGSARFEMIRREVLIASLEKMREDAE